MTPAAPGELSPSGPAAEAGAGAPSALAASYRGKRSAALVVEARAAAAGAPFSAMLEIADRCNEACIHCYQVQGQKGELDTEQWKRVMRELAELGVMFLTFSGGEATLRKDFLELVAHARELRFAVRVFTNGLNVDAAMAAELGRLSVQEVQISLYSHRAEVHDRVTRVPGSFERVVSAARALGAAGVRVLLKSPLMSLNAAEYAEYVEYVTGLGCHYTLDPKLNPREDGDTAPTALSIDKQTYLALRRDQRFAAAPVRRERTLDAAPCSACRGNVHVEPNGELRPCTQWSIPTGHVLAGSLRDTWYGHATAVQIRGLTWNDLPGCRGCDLRHHCQRCFADAERATGDALSPYARACQSALWKYEADLGVAPELDSASGQCDAQPIGPFRRVGEHRFLIEPRAARGEAGSAQALARPSFLPPGPAPSPDPALPPTLVPLRRHAAGPSLTSPTRRTRAASSEPDGAGLPARAGTTVA